MATAYCRVVNKPLAIYKSLLMNQPIGHYPPGFSLSFDEVVRHAPPRGEHSSNPNWGHNMDGDDFYFWLGGTDNPDGRSNG